MNEAKINKLVCKLDELKGVPERDLYVEEE